MVINDKGLRILINNDGMKLLLTTLNNHLSKMQEKDGDSLEN